MTREIDEMIERAKHLKRKYFPTYGPGKDACMHIGRKKEVA